jgi:hypothetical protein
VAPGKSNQPELNDFLREHLQDAIKAGFRIIHFPRIAGFVNMEVEPYRYKLDKTKLNDYLDTIFTVGERIEKLEAGYAWLKKIGEKYNNKNPFEGIGQAPDSENNTIAKAVAEWADGDSIACTVAIGAKYFCTNDKAKGAGDKSVMSADNLIKLNREYGLKVIDPISLVQQFNPE